MEVMQQEHILSDEISLVQASTGKRFANYLIDLITFYVFIFSVGIVIGIMNPTFFDFLEDNPGAQILDRLITFVLIGLFIGTVEAIFKGKTLGKVITGTRVVNEDGTPISAGTAFKRGFCRMVPFYQFSALGNPSYPWHDRWTNTYVIDEKTSILPQTEMN